MIEQTLGRSGYEQHQMTWLQSLFGWIDQCNLIIDVVFGQFGHLSTEGGQRFDRDADLSEIGHRLLVCIEAGAVHRRCEKNMKGLEGFVFGNLLMKH